MNTSPRNSPLPDEVFVDDLFADATGNTRAIVISHITSPTSLILPVAQVCQRARERGILTIIDGAQARGSCRLI